MILNILFSIVVNMTPIVILWGLLRYIFRKGPKQLKKVLNICVLTALMFVILFSATTYGPRLTVKPDRPLNVYEPKTQNIEPSAPFVENEDRSKIFSEILENEKE